LLAVAIVARRKLKHLSPHDDRDYARSLRKNVNYANLQFLLHATKAIISTYRNVLFVPLISSHVKVIAFLHFTYSSRPRFPAGGMEAVLVHRINFELFVLAQLTHLLTLGELDSTS
jgi:hypothetical protein